MTPSPTVQDCQHLGPTAVDTPGATEERGEGVEEGQDVLQATEVVQGAANTVVGREQEVNTETEGELPEDIIDILQGLPGDSEVPDDDNLSLILENEKVPWWPLPTVIKMREPWLLLGGRWWC